MTEKIHKDLEARVKAILKLKNRLAPLEVALATERDELKLRMLEAGACEFDCKAGNATIKTPVETTWDVDGLKSVLTGEEFAELCPARAEKAALTKRILADSRFKEAVEGYCVQKNGTPRLNVEAK